MEIEVSPRAEHGELTVQEVGVHMIVRSILELVKMSNGPDDAAALDLLVDISLLVCHNTDLEPDALLGFFQHELNTLSRQTHTTPEATQ